MTSLDETTVAVRAYIAEQTQAIHQELHHNPVLKPLTDPNISEPQYFAAIGVFCSFYNAIEQERRRFDVWREFSLTAECDALNSDTKGFRAPTATLAFATEFEALGGLYVAHGASFGRGLFRRNLQGTIADAPKRFVAMRTSKTTWAALSQAMEHHGQDQAALHAIQTGAQNSFEAVKRLSRAS